MCLLGRRAGSWNIKNSLLAQIKVVVTLLWVEKCSHPSWHENTGLEGASGLRLSPLESSFMWQHEKSWIRWETVAIQGNSRLSSGIAFLQILTVSSASCILSLCNEIECTATQLRFGVQMGRDSLTKAESSYRAGELWRHPVCKGLWQCVGSWLKFEHLREAMKNAVVCVND